MASRTVRARLDPETEEDFEFLVAGGLTESEAVRAGLRAARRERERELIREEVRRVANDPVDRGEIARVMADMQSAAPPLPPA